MTDNFATALVTHSSDAIHLGALAISKSKESAAFIKRLKDEFIDDYGDQNSLLNKYNLNQITLYKKMLSLVKKK